MNDQSGSRRVRRLSRLLIFSVALGVAWSFQDHFLTMLAKGLTVDSDRPASDIVLVLEQGDRRFDVAERLARDEAKSILLYRRRPDRLEQRKLIPSVDELARRELKKRNVADEKLASLPEVSIGRSHLVRVLSDWLIENPDRSVDLLGDRFQSRTWNVVVRRTADAAVRSRIRVVPLAHRAYDETNWWRSKRGVRAVMDAYLSLAFHVLRRGPEPTWSERTPDELRASFAAEGAP